MTSRAPRRDVQWLDGLRGLASFTVVCTHITRAFDDKLFFAADDQGIPPRLLQYPFVRLIFQGNIGVAVFALLTGYVCALKPLRQARQGNQEAALSTIAKGAFRRIPRLVLPASIALIIAWALAQFGAFTAASRSDSEWLRISTGISSLDLFTELHRLWLNLLATWTGERTEYDDHQWTLLPLLNGSLLSFLLVAALIYTKFEYRMAVYVAFMGYWWQNPHPDTETFQQMAVWGVLLCDFSQSSQYQLLATEKRQYIGPLSATLIVFGLYLASFPKYWMSARLLPWSNTMLWIGEYIFPADVDYARRFSALGVQLTTLGLQLWPRAQEVLANRVFLALGRYSFAVYLIHGTLLRSILVWAEYGITGQPWEITIDQDGLEILPPWLPRRFHGLPFILMVVLWLCCVYYCAYLWTTYIDSWCARFTQRLESKCFESNEEKALRVSQV